MRLIRRPFAWLLSAMLTLMPMLPVQAAMIGTDQIVNPAQSGLDRDELARLFDEEAAQQQLLAWGVSPDWIKARVSSLTDAELARISQETDNLKAGGESILGILALIFIVCGFVQAVRSIS